MKRNTKTVTLKHPLNPVQGKVKQMLLKARRWDAYLAHPAYQRNDCIGGITRARVQATKEKRTRQILDELKQGDRYMKMQWRPR